jgi:hypothetical protein
MAGRSFADMILVSVKLGCPVGLVVPVATVVARKRTCENCPCWCGDAVTMAGCWSVTGSVCASVVFDGTETLGFRGTRGGAPRISFGKSTGRSLRPRGGLIMANTGAEEPPVSSVELCPAVVSNSSTGWNLKFFVKVGLFGVVTMRNGGGDATRSTARAGGGDFGNTLVLAGCGLSL